MRRFETKEEIAKVEGDNSSQEVLQPNIVEVGESYSKTSLNNAVCTDEVKVMRMPWNTNSNILKFKFENLVNYSEKESVTKRAILNTLDCFHPSPSPSSAYIKSYADQE